MEINELMILLEKESERYSKEFNITRDSEWFMFKMQEELGELTQKYLMLTKRGRQKGLTEEEIRKQVEFELADVLSIVLLFAKYHNIDVIKAVEQKWLKK